MDQFYYADLAMTPVWTPPPPAPEVNTKPGVKIECATYLKDTLEPRLRRELIDRIKHRLSPHNFDAIAFRGLSGALVAPIVALEMEKTLLAVRKKGDSNHSGRVVEGDYGARRYIILDDFQATGDTVRAIRTAIASAVPSAECIGLYEYYYVTSQLKPLA